MNQTPLLKGDLGKGENLIHVGDTHVLEDVLQAAVIALTAFFRCILCYIIASFYVTLQL